MCSSDLGHVVMNFDTMPPVLPFVRQGKMKALAVTTPKRASQLADVPTMLEAGLKGFEMTNWYGMMAPAGTPEPVVNLLSAELSAIGKLPDVRDALAKAGIESNPGSAPEMARTIAAEIDKWGKVIRAAGIQPQ